MSKTIAIAVGGTGGHVLPAQTTGKRFSKYADVFYLGVGLTKNTFIQSREALIYDIEGGNFSNGVVKGIKKIVSGFVESKQILQKNKVDLVVGWGSYHSLPVILAAGYLGIPYTLVEPNVIPGKVNRLLSKWAINTLIQFDPAAEKLYGLKKLIHYDFSNRKDSFLQKEAREHFGLDPKKETLLVFGGSQGAEVINKCMAKIAKQIPKNFQIIHFTGGNTKIKQVYESENILSYVTGFSNEMEKAWIACDIAICRSGAGALREMLIYEKSAILIPYPHASDSHQEINAKFIEKTVGGGICMNQSDLTPQHLLKTILDLFKDNRKTLKVRENRLLTFKHQENRPDILEIIKEMLCM